MSGSARRRARAVVVALALLLGTVVTGQPDAPRLLVMDASYEHVWERVLRALDGYPLASAAAGIIETARVERPPRVDEPGVERVAERVTVHVEAMAPLVTRVTVTVEAEGLRGGRWQPLDGSPATVRAVLDRIRAGKG